MSKKGDLILSGEKIVINVEDFPEIEAAMESVKGQPAYDVYKAMFEGPASGVDYIDETGKCQVHSAWHVDSVGNIVKN